MAALLTGVRSRSQVRPNTGASGRQSSNVMKRTLGFFPLGPVRAAPETVATATAAAAEASIDDIRWETDVEVTTSS